jgi:NitT/TauT family transport system ATP-binding protein
MADRAVLLRTGREDAPSSASSLSATAPHVTVRGLTKRFGTASIYDRFDLDIPRGKLVSVFGPNGCGKSTLINIIAGLIPPDAGEILFDGKPLRAIKFGYVFQNYREALFPWLRSVDNIEYPLKLMKLPKAERRARVEKLVAHLGVKIDLKRYPYEMSGGQQQLISIMRALVVEPEILFLDEPSASLDPASTLAVEELIGAAYARGTSIVLVTHDLGQARRLADEVVFVHQGRIVEQSPAEHFFGRPASEPARAYLAGQIVI